MGKTCNTVLAILTMFVVTSSLISILALVSWTKPMPSIRSEVLTMDLVDNRYYSVFTKDYGSGCWSTGYISIKIDPNITKGKPEAIISRKRNVLKDRIYNTYITLIFNDKEDMHKFMPKRS